MPRSSLIAVVTFSSVAFSAMVSVVWLITSSGVSRLEPLVQTFGLLGGLTGVLAERRAAARERRNLALVTLMDELRSDTAILDDPQFAPSEETPRPRVYLRLPVSATDAALTSGALAERSDAVLLRRLHSWRDEVNGFNRRLELTEMRVFTAGIPAEIAEFERSFHRSDGYLNQIRRHLRDLQDYLAKNYQIKLKHYGTLDDNGGPDTGTKVGEQPRWRLFHRLGLHRLGRLVSARTVPKRRVRAGGGGGRDTGGGGRDTQVTPSAPEASALLTTPRPDAPAVA